MDDEAYARELFRILTRPLDLGEAVDAYGTGPDGIDRYQGFGTEVWVTSIDVVPGQHGAQIEVGFAFDVADLTDVPPEGSTLLPFAAAWREAQGCVTPALYAPQVAAQVERAAGRHIERGARPPEPEPDLPDRATQATWLRELERDHAGVGIVATPDEWEQVVRSHHGRRAWLDEDVSELDGSRHRDDRFLVFWEGHLERSVRSELPPVSGALRALLAMRAAGQPRLGPGDGWFAYRPLEDDELPG
ncbi:hypothetical protein [Nocardioides hwasunensis]|uniref:Uncharacterized protein n=1 Tax=Nocardioides hwasunensis TaxID=397258 RepID=A0ABR8MI51_9ACTN|nr:hypothetical protein [Nocardioides hwasunensis]MBD3915250.1 hypothetical protein [Nocardioides hwasunensis]